MSHATNAIAAAPADVPETDRRWLGPGAQGLRAGVAAAGARDTSLPARHHACILASAWMASANARKPFSVAR